MLHVCSGGFQTFTSVLQVCAVYLSNTFTSFWLYSTWYGLILLILLLFWSPFYGLQVFIYVWWCVTIIILLNKNEDFVTERLLLLLVLHSMAQNRGTVNARKRLYRQSSEKDLLHWFLMGFQAHSCTHRLSYTHRHTTRWIWSLHIYSATFAAFPVGCWCQFSIMNSAWKMLDTWPAEKLHWLELPNTVCP